MFLQPIFSHILDWGTPNGQQTIRFRSFEPLEVSERRRNADVTPPMRQESKQKNLSLSKIPPLAFRSFPLRSRRHLDRAETALPRGSCNDKSSVPRYLWGRCPYYCKAWSPSLLPIFRRWLGLERMEPGMGDPWRCVVLHDARMKEWKTPSDQPRPVQIVPPTPCRWIAYLQLCSGGLWVQSWLLPGVGPHTYVFWWRPLRWEAEPTWAEPRLYTAVIWPTLFL